MNLTLSQAVAHFGKMVVTVEAAKHVALDAASRAVLDRAKSEPGTYQGAAPPFEAWAPLAQSTLDEKAREGWPSPSPLLRTGEMRDSYERTVGVDSAWVGSNDDKAVWHEFGTSRMPARSVLGIAGVNSTPEILDMTGRVFYGLLASGKVKIPFKP